MIRNALLGFVSAAFAATAGAQIVVDPAGGGAFTQLQAAIDAAPPGAVIRVKAGSYGSLLITKSLTIVGDPAPLIASVRTGIGTQPPAITLAGAGADRLTLANVVVRGPAEFPYNGPGPGISVRGFAEVRIVDSRIHGHQYDVRAATGLFAGAPALEVAPGAAPRIWIVASHLEASDAGTDGTLAFGFVGAAAIDAAASTVIATESTIVGGDGSRSFLPSAPAPVPCPCDPSWGTGGDAVVAAAYFAQGNFELPGAGGEVFLGGQPPYVPWGQQSPGLRALVGVEHVAGFPLIVPAPMQLGRTWTVSFALFSTQAALMVAGAPAAPSALAGPWIYFDPLAPLVVLPLSGSAASASLAVPAVAALGGAELVLQVVALLSGGGLDTSRPALEVIRY